MLEPRPAGEERASSALADARPSVLLILLDDLGRDDLGIHGNGTVRTPHIDTAAGQSADAGAVAQARLGAIILHRR